MTPAQSRAARELLRLTEEQLADMADLSVSTIEDFERGKRSIPEDVVETIQVALETAGVEFVLEIGGGAKVRLRT